MDLQFDASFAETPGGAVSGNAITANNPFSDTFVLQTDATGPLWYAEDVRAPEEVPAGGVVDIAVDMVNERTVITPLNPDQCTDGLTNGLESEVTIQPDWTDGQTVTDCLAAGGFTPSRRTHEFGFPAPTEPGTYTFSVEVRAPGSGEGGIETFQLVVPSPDDGGSGLRPDPDPPGGEDGDGDSDSGGNPFENLIDSLTLGTDSAAVPLVILVVILVALLYLTAI
ncbi:hypothetical protein [uncultured Halorubrum sp.]|uniref:hypothetical protein n=1 Tax=uncultured Halorubrum sp. TaxID=399555 RepID=UPI0026063FF7|nr:hypothetical protein [uncultured Halorubrum sp.]